MTKMLMSQSHVQVDISFISLPTKNPLRFTIDRGTPWFLLTIKQMFYRMLFKSIIEGLKMNIKSIKSQSSLFVVDNQ